MSRASTRASTAQPTDAGSSPASARVRAWNGLVVGLATLAFLILTEPSLAIVWDEGYTLGRIERVRNWLTAMADPAGFARRWVAPGLELVQSDGPPAAGHAPVVPPTPDQLDTRSKLLAPEVVLYFWPFAREEPHGHPPFYAIVGLAGDLFFPWRAPLPRARLGTMLAFSLAAGWLFATLQRRFDRWAAVGGWAALILQPRLFAHAHYATYDALLTALWLMAILAFARAVEFRPLPPELSNNPPPRRNPAWGWVLVWSLTFACACATKITGWMIPLPLFAWALVYRDRRALLTLLVGGLIAIPIIVLLVPPWWHNPVGGFQRFVTSNTGRADTIPIQAMFLGKIYRTPAESLPWYNTIALTAMVTPVGFLLLALAGTVSTLRSARSSRFGVLVLGNWAFLLILRALPHVPAHDNERLFLPAFGCLALMAGLGAGALVAWLGRWGRILLSVFIAEALVGLLLLFPVPLSYYSPLIGGLPGATRLGMEPTYYWDSLTHSTLDWLRENTPPGGKIAFASQPTSLLYLQRSGQLRAGILPGEPGRYVWYVLQNRSGSLSPADRRLLGSGRAAYIYSRQGVPLLWVFPFSDFEQALRSPVVEVPR